MSGVLWVERASGRGQFKPLIDLPGNLARPLWVGGRIYFVSDHEGVGNLYSCTADGDDLRRHSNHDAFYVRHPTTDGERIVYHAGADLWVFDPRKRGATPRRLAVTLRSPRAQLARRFVQGAAYIEDAALHPRGHMAVVIARGKPHLMGLFEGPVWRLGEAHGVRHRLARFLNDHRRLVVISDASGEEAIEVWDSEGLDAPIRLDGLDIGRPLDLHVSPIDDVIVLTNHRYELLRVDLSDPKAPSASVLDRSLFERISGVSWSPCGNFVAYGCADQAHTSCIKLADLRSGQVHALTDVEFRDTDPSFDPDGRFLFFLSMRDFDPVQDAQAFDMGFPEGQRICLITLSAELTSPFIKEPRPLDDDPRHPEDAPPPPPDLAAAAAAAAAIPSDAPPPRPDPLRIDLPGIQQRVLLLPIPPGQYGQVACDGDRVIYTSFPIHGSLSPNGDDDDDDDDSDGRLEVFDLDTLEDSVAMEDVSSFSVCADGKTLLVWSEGRLRAVSTRQLSAGIDRDGPGDRGHSLSSDRAPGRKSGWLNLSRVIIEVSPLAEWRQMLTEAWRLMRDHFWDPQMAGVDWVAVRDLYAPLLSRVGCRGEFSDLIWEMQGELGTSHAYELGGDYRVPPHYLPGSLAADISFDRAMAALRIDRIIQGDTWDERASSPLTRPGLQVHEGDWILAINGQPPHLNTSVSEMLLNLGGDEVSLTILSLASLHQTLPPSECEPAPPPDALSDTLHPDPTPDTPSTSGEGGDHPPPLCAADADTSADADADADGSSDDDAPAPELPLGPLPRLITTRALYGDRAARYRDWVRVHTDAVHAASDGLIGYVHIPDMGPSGFGAFHRAFHRELSRPALIIDVRYNSGGHISSLLLEKLARRRLGYDLPRWGAPVPYPLEARRGPLAALINEYTGSDGDVFGHSFKRMNLGPLIGKRSWGGVVGTWPRHDLVDGSTTSQPEFSFCFQDVGWQVENHGAEPDVVVEITPQDQAAGRDPQLARAVSLLLKTLQRHPPDDPVFPPTPSRRPPWQR
jgi:tricorn protease